MKRQNYLNQQQHGRKFFKKGERVIDICNEEILRYKNEKSILLIRLLNKRKFNNKKEKYMLESRTSNIIRSIAAYSIRNNEEVEINSIDVSKDVKEYIFNIVEEYYEKNSKKNKVIDIKTKENKEVS